MAKIQEVPTADSRTDTEPLEQVQYNARYNVFANERQHSEQPESISNTCVVEKVDSNFIPDSPDMRDNDIQIDQNDIQKQLKKANTSLAHELKECKSILIETSRTPGESNSIRDSCLIALQNKQTELDTYKTLNDRTLDYDKLENKLNETLGLLAQKEIDIKEGLKLKAYEISVVKEKYDELVKQILLTKSHYEGLVKEKTKVITDLKLKEEKYIDKMISMEKQLKFLNDIVYKRNQSIQTIHMLAPKGPTFNGRSTFSNPMYLKKAQSEKPCLYAIPYDQSDPANRLVLNREETLTLEEESRSKLNKDKVRPYDYRKLNSIYEIFKPATQEYHEQLAHANEVRKKMWRKSFVKTKPKFFKNISFLPVSKSVSKSRQAYNVMTNNINHFRELVDQTWEKHSHDHFHAPTAHDMEILIKTCLMPLAIKTQNDSFTFVHELKQEMHDDLKYVESLEKEIDELEYDKEEFSNMYGDLVQGNIMINRVYYLFSVGQFCDADLEVAFWKTTGTEFLNKTLNVFFKEEGIKHQTSTPRTPEQNGVVKRQNRILVEAARTMLSASKLPLFCWAEAIATVCYTQNRSIIIPTHKKMAYHIINDRKPLIKHLHIFGCTCYLTRDGENLDKMKEKGNPCILVGYSTQSKGYRVYNKRTRLIVESIHLRFNEIKEMAKTSVANNTSGLVPLR
ncbi:retrovirus-related pol polyprotein from transposon TNT 1-94 [Tanacetum coccineum]